MTVDEMISCIPHELRCRHQDTVMVLRPWLCDRCTAEDVWELYKKVNQAYRDGRPFMCDDRFNIFEQLVRDRFPYDKRFWKVGDTK